MSNDNEALVWLAWIVSRRFGVRNHMLEEEPVVNSVAELPPVVTSGTSADSLCELLLVEGSGTAASEFPPSGDLELRRYLVKFVAFCQLSIPGFDNLLHVLRPYLLRQDTCMRLSISPEERFLVTLRQQEPALDDVDDGRVVNVALAEDTDHAPRGGSGGFPGMSEGAKSQASASRTSLAGGRRNQQPACTSEDSGVRRSTRSRSNVAPTPPRSAETQRSRKASMEEKPASVQDGGPSGGKLSAHGGEANLTEEGLGAAETPGVCVHLCLPGHEPPEDEEASKTLRRLREELCCTSNKAAGSSKPRKNQLQAEVRSLKVDINELEVRKAFIREKSGPSKEKLINEDRFREMADNREQRQMGLQPECQVDDDEEEDDQQKAPPGSLLSHSPFFSLFPVVQIFFDTVSKDICNLKLRSGGPQNLTREERHCLQHLKKQDSFAIKEADKGGNVVIWPKDLYVLEARRQLSNSSHYQVLPSDPTEVFKGQLDRLIRNAFDLGIINKKERGFLTTDVPRVPTFYMLPKVHKRLDNPPGSYIRDSMHLIEQIGNLDIPVDTYIVTLDVESLYTSIEHSLGIGAVTFFLDCKSTVRSSTLVTLHRNLDVGRNSTYPASTRLKKITLKDIVPVYQIKGISKLFKLCLPKVQCFCDSLTSPPSERQFNALLMSVASLLANILLRMGFKAIDIYALIHPYSTPDFDVSFVWPKGLQRRQDRELSEPRATGAAPVLDASLAAEALRDDKLDEEVRRIHREESATASESSHYESMDEDNRQWLDDKRKLGTKKKRKKGDKTSSPALTKVPKEGKTDSPLVGLSNRFQALENISFSEEEAEGEVLSSAGFTGGAESPSSGNVRSLEGGTGPESRDKDDKKKKHVEMDTSVSLKRGKDSSSEAEDKGSGKKAI
ncbi:unnamed protein product [Ranitomeya imitator]|uniref:Uncharacterized protein n=1 Tax=Ranitomeya imitator TaxID=111125 RepID=A0ABN9LJL9_9NEOB|nr:unnamed protein product [Ranitomeya imitator]